MKKNAIMIFALGWLGLILMAGTKTYLKVNVRRAPIRSQPKKNSQLLGRLQFGTLLEMLSRHGKWYHIKEKSGTLRGYVHDNFVEEVVPSAQGFENQKKGTRKKRGLKGPRPGRRLQKNPQLKQSNLQDPQVSLALKIHTWKGYTFYLKAQDPDSEKIEMETVNMLKDLIETFPVSPWVRVKEIIIKKGGISQSNPFTINTRHNKDRYMLLATFLHEQIHRLEPEHLTEFNKAMQEVEKLFPDLPPEFTKSKRDIRAAYRHFIVNYFEIEALKKLLGEVRGLGVIMKKDKNVWIYQQILIQANAEKLRRIYQRHNLNPEYR